MDSSQTSSALLAYYSQILVPLRAELLESRREYTTDVDEVVDEAIEWLAVELPRHRGSERPLLTYVAWLLGGGDPHSSTPALAAIASELVHEGGLAHDDIVDNSTLRRFQATHWARYAATRGGEPWSADFGKNVALWLGNLLLWWADDIFSEATHSVPKSNAEVARRLWVRSLTQIWASQHLDLVEGAGGCYAIRESSVRKVISLKGRYVATAPLQLGAALAGAEQQLMRILQDYGDPLGEAYVLRNDLEGMFGTETTTDKTADDLRERRTSMLVHIAYERSTPKQRNLLQLAGNSNLSADDVVEIARIIEHTGARARVETLIGELADRAIAAVEEGAIAEWAKPFLVGGVHKALEAGKYGYRR